MYNSYQNNNVLHTINHNTIHNNNNRIESSNIHNQHHPYLTYLNNNIHTNIPYNNSLDYFNNIENIPPHLYYNNYYLDNISFSNQFSDNIVNLNNNININILQSSYNNQNNMSNINQSEPIKVHSPQQQDTVQDNDTNVNPNTNTNTNNNSNNNIEPTTEQNEASPNSDNVHNAIHSSASDASDATNPEDQERKLFVGGLSWDTSDRDFREYFSQYGELDNTQSTIMRDRISHQSRGFGFIVYIHKESRIKALSKPVHHLDNRNIEVKPSISKQEMNQPGYNKTKKIFIGGLPNDTNESHLTETFAKFGTIRECVIQRDKKSNKSRGFGFIIFSNEEIVDIIFDHLANNNTFSILGQEVEVKRAVPKEPQWKHLQHKQQQHQLQWRNQNNNNPGNNNNNNNAVNQPIQRRINNSAPINYTSPHIHQHLQPQNNNYNYYDASAAAAHHIQQVAAISAAAQQVAVVQAQAQLLSNYHQNELMNPNVINYLPDYSSVTSPGDLNNSLNMNGYYNDYSNFIQSPRYPIRYLDTNTNNNNNNTINRNINTNLNTSIVTPLHIAQILQTPHTSLSHTNANTNNGNNSAKILRNHAIRALNNSSPPSVSSIITPSSINISNSSISDIKLDKSTDDSNGSGGSNDSKRSSQANIINTTNTTNTTNTSNEIISSATSVSTISDSDVDSNRPRYIRQLKFNESGK